MVESCFRQACGSARILFADRCFVLPASDEYDVSLVLDHGRYLAKRYGRAEVQVGDQSWEIQGSGTFLAADELARRA